MSKLSFNIMNKKLVFITFFGVLCVLQNSDFSMSKAHLKKKIFQGLVEQHPDFYYYLDTPYTLLESTEVGLYEQKKIELSPEEQQKFIFTDYLRGCTALGAIVKHESGTFRAVMSHYTPGDRTQNAQASRLQKTIDDWFKKSRNVKDMITHKALIILIPGKLHYGKFKVYNYLKPLLKDLYNYFAGQDVYRFFYTRHKLSDVGHGYRLEYHPDFQIELSQKNGAIVRQFGDGCFPHKLCT